MVGFDKNMVNGVMRVKTRLVGQERGGKELQILRVNNYFKEFCKKKKEKHDGTRTKQ